MSNERVETRVIGPVELTGPARLLDQIRTATEADLHGAASAPAPVVATELVPPQVARWMLGVDRPGDAASES